MAGVIEQSILILILIPWGSHNGDPWFSYCLLVLGRILWKILAQNLQQEKKLTNKAYSEACSKRTYLNRKQFWKYPPYYRQIQTDLLTCLVSVRLSKELIYCPTSSYQNSWQHSDFPGQSWNKQLIFHSPPIGRKKKNTCESISHAVSCVPSCFAIPWTVAH